MSDKKRRHPKEDAPIICIQVKIAMDFAAVADSGFLP